MVKRPLEGRRFGHYWHVLQTANAAEIAFNRYVNLFPRHARRYLWAKRPNESERTVYLTGFREVTFKSGGEYDNLRAETLDGCIIDELREQAPELWPMIIRPMLARHGGWAEFYTTPNGFDHTYDLYQSALLNPNEWDVFHAPSTEAWWWTPEEIASAKANMTEAQFAQEILAEFRDLHVGKAYGSTGTHNWLEQNPFAPKGGLWSPYLPIIVGADFNINPMIWHLGQFKVDKIWWGDCIDIEGTDSQECAKELVDRVKSHPMGIVLIGDATGKSKSTKSVGKSDYDLIHSVLKEEKIRFEDRTPDSNPPVKDRVTTVNVRCKNKDGGPDFVYNPKTCKKLSRDFERVMWKKGATVTLDKTTDPTLTHASDSVGYPTCVLMPIKGVDEVGRMRVIKR